MRFRPKKKIDCSSVCRAWDGKKMNFPSFPRVEVFRSHFHRFFALMQRFLLLIPYNVDTEYELHWIKWKWKLYQIVHSLCVCKILHLLELSFHRQDRSSLFMLYQMLPSRAILYYSDSIRGAIPPHFYLQTWKFFNYNCALRTANLSRAKWKGET